MSFKEYLTEARKLKVKDISVKLKSKGTLEDEKAMFFTVYIDGDEQKEQIAYTKDNTYILDDFMEILYKRSYVDKKVYPALFADWKNGEIK